MAKRDISKPIYYLDSCVLIDLIELPESDTRRQTMVSILEAAEDGRCNLVTSVLTISEVVFAKHEKDGQLLDPRISESIEKLWHPQSSPIQLVDVHELIVREANRLLQANLSRGWTKTRGADAIHLVTAQREFVDEFLTTEDAMNKWGPVLGFKVCEPHFEAPPPPPDSGERPLFGDNLGS